MLKRVPAAGWVCAAIAVLSAASWSFITPAFEVTDEPSHVAYVKQLAETGKLPVSEGERFSPEEAQLLQRLHYLKVRSNPGHGALLSRIEQAQLEGTADRFTEPSERGSPEAGVAKGEPPLYYALMTIPYSLAAHGTLLERIQLMRLATALMAGFTALFALLFIREALPADPFACVVGGLAVALSPLFGFMSGGVNPDGLLFAVSAALFYLLARAFRRGLTRRSAIATGLVIAAGFATKLNFVGLAPGALLALALLAWREARGGGRPYRPAIAAGIGLLPLLALLARHPAAGGLLSGLPSILIEATPKEALKAANYAWQLYLPRLPGMRNDFPSMLPTLQIWFDGYVGRLGWLDTFFPGWVYTLALVLFAPIALLCVRALAAGRSRLRSRASEILAYLGIAAGLFVLIAGVNYDGFPQYEAAFGQARYFLPLLPLFGAFIALAVRGAGRRWGPSVGVVMVALFLAHDLFSQLQVVGRFYG